MQIAIIVILTIIILAFIVAYFYITIYNKIQFSKMRVEQAEKVILDELEVRYKLIEKSKKAISKNTKMDIDIFNEIEKIKKTNINSIDFEKKITEGVQTIYLIINDYPKLTEKKEIKNLIRKLNESDTKITASKSFYNKNNKELINQIRKFPANIIALMHKIKIRPYYDTVEVFDESNI